MVQKIERDFRNLVQHRRQAQFPSRGHVVLPESSCPSRSDASLATADLGARLGTRIVLQRRDRLSCQSTVERDATLSLR